MLWEMRNRQEHFVYSKVMNWVALDRGLRLADKRALPADRAKWLRERDRIYEEVMAKGWNEKRHAFTQFYGSEDLDASLSPQDCGALRQLVLDRMTVLRALSETAANAPPVHSSGLWNAVTQVLVAEGRALRDLQPDLAAATSTRMDRDDADERRDLSIEPTDPQE